jgi:hypothetical protein
MAGLVATGIPSYDVHLAWPQIWPLLKPAYEKSREKTDLLAGIVSNNLQAWAIYENNTPVAGIVTRLWRVGTSGELQCRIWLVGGSRLSEWAPDFISKLIPWAKAEGCDRINGGGRKGWARIVSRFGGVRAADEDDAPAWELRL